MRHTGLVLALAFAGGPLAAQQHLDTAGLRTLRPQVLQSGPRTRLRTTEPNTAPLRDPDAFAAGPLGAQQPDSATLARARAVLRHDLFALSGWPIVSVEVRPCGPHCLIDSVVVVRQRRDTVTLELTEGRTNWIPRGGEGPLERCRAAGVDGGGEYPRDILTLAMFDCISPLPYQTIEHVWLVLRGPLPDRARGELLSHLVQFTWSPARLRPN